MSVAEGEGVLAGQSAQSSKEWPVQKKRRFGGLHWAPGVWRRGGNAA